MYSDGRRVKGEGEEQAGMRAGVHNHGWHGAIRGKPDRAGIAAYDWIGIQKANKKYTGAFRSTESATCHIPHPLSHLSNPLPLTTASSSAMVVG